MPSDRVPNVTDLRKKYLIKKIFGPTIQGEGSLSGTVCHFIRFSHCNMWDGRPETKAKSECPYCDTDFLGGDMMTVEQIIEKLLKLKAAPWVTLSGGEPALQLDYNLVTAIQKAGFRVAVETNGSVPLPTGVDHLTVSPKVPMAKLKLKSANTLKLLFPHPTLLPEDFDYFECKERYLQPIIDVKEADQNISATLKKVLESRGFWKISIQLHKLLGVE